MDIHPFMLSKWRKQVRDGVLQGRGRYLRVPPAREIRRLQELERAHALLQEEHELLKKFHPVLLRSKPAIFAFIATQADRYAVTRLCALYGVTPAGYYAWRRRPASAYTEQDRQLTQQITTLYRAHDGRYGSPRIHRELPARGWRVSRRRVERLLRAAGLRARVARLYRGNPALSHRSSDIPQVGSLKSPHPLSRGQE